MILILLCFIMFMVFTCLNIVCFLTYSDTAARVFEVALLICAFLTIINVKRTMPSGTKIKKLIKTVVIIALVIFDLIFYETLIYNERQVVSYTIVAEGEEACNFLGKDVYQIEVYGSKRILCSKEMYDKIMLSDRRDCVLTYRSFGASKPIVSYLNEVDF